METSSPKRRKLSSNHSDTDLSTSLNRNGDGNKRCRINGSTCLGESWDRSVLPQANEVDPSRFAPSLAANRARSPPRSLAPSTAHVAHENKQVNSNNLTNGTAGEVTRLPSDESVSVRGLRSEGNHNSYAVGSKDQQPHVNGVTVPEDGCMEVTVNGIVEREGESVAGAPAETDSDSEDELPLPSSIHSMRSYEDTPPKGLLYSSPSGRRRKQLKKHRSFTSTAPASSSPLRNITADVDGAGDIQSVTRLDKNGSKDEDGDDHGTMITSANNESRQESQTFVSAEEVDDEHLKEKLEQISEYQQKIASLKKDIGAINHQFSINERSTVEKVAEHEGLDELLDIVHRYLGEEEEEEVGTPRRRTTAIPLSRSLTSFLPFAKPVPIASAPKEVAQCAESSPVDDLTLYLNQNPHHLNLEPSSFTSIDFKRSVSINPNKSNGTTVIQLHTISFFSPRNLLSGILELNYDAATDTRSAIRLVTISSWADEELGSWIRKKAEEKENHGDINNIAWGIGRYWDVALSRARCWMRCEKAYAEIVEGWVASGGDGGSPFQSKMDGKKEEKTQKRLQHHSREMGPRRNGVDDQNDASINDSSCNSGGSDTDADAANKITADDAYERDSASAMHNIQVSSDPDRYRSADDLSIILYDFFSAQDQNQDLDRDRDQEHDFPHATNNANPDPDLSSDALQQHLGCRLLKLHGHGGDVELYINGQIEIDWTGEVTFTPDVDLAVPTAWHKSDEHNSFGEKISLLFRHLKRRGGVYRAVRALLELIYP